MSNKTRIAITLDTELMPKLDKEGKKTDRSRSALINHVLNKFFKDREK